MNYIKMTKFDTANGPGVRVVLWTSGCSHHCKGCHNPETWDPGAGTMFSSSDWKELLDTLNQDYISGITFSGGDPLYKDNLFLVTMIAISIKSLFPDKTIWLYTGYSYEWIKDLEILDYIDVLVDGEFILEKKDITLLYRGSSNQRVIDMKKSKASGEIVLFE